jgi:uncharacterized caspase-like protein
VNDAKDLAAQLSHVGFLPQDITLVTDADLVAMEKASIEFLEKLRADDLALVFYSGHGVEVRGENYLVPVDFPANATELEVQFRAFSAQQLLRNLEAGPARARIIILDACRDNPLRATRSASGGLARMDGSGTLIVFATGSGRTADDNATGRNGFFTAHLLHDLSTPGLSITNLMEQVGREVNRDSGGKQTPALYGLLLEDFALVPKLTSDPVPGPNSQGLIVGESVQTIDVDKGKIIYHLPFTLEQAAAAASYFKGELDQKPVDMDGFFDDPGSSLEITRSMGVTVLSVTLIGLGQDDRSGIENGDLDPGLRWAGRDLAEHLGGLPIKIRLNDQTGRTIREVAVMPFFGLFGRVLDPSGASIGGARVRAVNQGTGDYTEIPVPSSGIFEFPNVEPGNYTLEARSQAFKTYRRTGIVVRPKMSTKVDAFMQVGQDAK